MRCHRHLPPRVCHAARDPGILTVLVAGDPSANCRCRLASLPTRAGVVHGALAMTTPDGMSMASLRESRI
jgi:hypothetical protein